MDKQKKKKNGLNSWTQRVGVSGAKFKWKPVKSRVLQGSVPSSIFFNLFIKNLNDGVEGTLSKFTDDAKLWGVANSPETHSSQRTYAYMA